MLHVWEIKNTAITAVFWCSYGKIEWKSSQLPMRFAFLQRNERELQHVLLYPVLFFI